MLTDFKTSAKKSYFYVHEDMNHVTPGQCMACNGCTLCSRKKRVRGEFPAPINNWNLSAKGDNPNRKTGRTKGRKVAAPPFVYSATRLVTCTEESTIYSQFPNQPRKLPKTRSAQEEEDSFYCFSAVVNVRDVNRNTEDTKLCLY